MSSRYRAFISYSQKDRKWGARLHRWLESYRVPPGMEADVGPQRRLGRFFRDDDELAAAADISALVKQAIDDSESLIVICSPRSAKSRWVAAEIHHFRRTGRGQRIFAFIVDGEPNSGDPATECFPPPLREGREETSGAFPREPVGVDVRKDGRSRACARLAAGLLRVDFDELWQRDRRRASKRQQGLIGGLSVAVAVFAGLAGIAVRQSLVARDNAQQAEAARASLLADTSARLRAEGDHPKALGYGAAALEIASSLEPEPDALFRAERALRQALFDHHLAPARLLVTYRGHEGRVTDVAVSEDKRLLATAGDDGAVRIYDYPSGDLLREVLHESPVARIAFAGNDRVLASASRDGVLKATSFDGAVKESTLTLGSRFRGMRQVLGGDGLLAWGLSGKVALWQPLAGELDEVALEPKSSVVVGTELVPGDDDKVLLDMGSRLAVVSVGERKEVRRFKGQVVGRDVAAGLTAHDSNEGLEVVDVQTGDTVCSVPGGGVRQVVVDAAADRLVISRYGQPAAELWGLGDCQPLKAPTMTDGIQGLLGLPESQRFLAWTKKGQLRLFDLADGELIQEIEAGFEVLEGDVSEAAGRVLLWSYGGGAGVWSLTDGAPLGAVEREAPIRDAKLSDTGRTAWIGRESGELEILSLESGALGGKFFHDDAVFGWHAPGSESDFLTWSADGTARRWSKLANDEGYRDHTAYRADHVALDAAGRVLFGTHQKVAAAWRLDEGEQIAQVEMNAPITSLLPSFDGESALLRGETGLCVWFTGRDTGTVCLEAEASARPLAFGSGSFAVVSPKTSVLALAGPGTGKEFVEVADDVGELSLVGPERALAVCRRNGQVDVYTAAGPQPSVTIRIGEELSACSGDEERNRFVVVAASGALTVIDLDPEASEEMDRWSPGVLIPQEQITRFNPVRVGQGILFAGRDGRLLWIDPGSRNVVLDEKLEDELSSPALSADGSKLGVVTNGTRALLFDRHGGRPLELQHRSKVLGFRFVGGGEGVVTWSSDRTLRFWNVADGRLEHEVQHFGIVQSVAVTPDGSMLVTRTDSREIVFWDLHSAAKLFELRPPGRPEAIRFLENPSRMLVTFEGVGPIFVPYLSRKELGGAAADLLAALRPFSRAEACVLQPAAAGCEAVEGERRRGQVSSLAGDGFLDDWKGAAELSILPDGGVLLVCKPAFSDMLQLVEYNDFDQMLTVYAQDGSSGVLSLPIPAHMMEPLRNQKTIIVYTLFPDHDPIGYWVPLVRQ